MERFLLERVRRILRGIRLVAVNILVFVLVLISLEILARTFSYFVSGKRFFRQNTFITPWITTYDYPPPIFYQENLAFFRHRDTPVAVEKPADVFRIVAVGGSTTVNENCFAETGLDYAMALERSLSKTTEGFRVEVLNAGGDGFSTAHSLVNIQFRLVEFKPDLILLMHNINDCSVNFFCGGATPDYANKYLQSYFLNPNLQGTRSLAGFLTQFRFLVKLELPQIIADKKGDINPDTSVLDGLRYFRRNLSSIAAICAQNQIRLVLMSQPISRKRHPFVNRAAFVTYNDAIKDVAADWKIDFIDLFSLFGHEGKFFVDPVHYSPSGIDRLAEILYERLRPMIEPGVVDIEQSGVGITQPDNPE